MANVNSVEYAKTITNPPTMLDPWQDHGKLRVAYGTYESTSTLAVNDTITMFVLPAGANVVGGYFWHDADNSSTTVDIGDAADPNGWLAGGVIGTAQASLNIATLSSSASAVIGTAGVYWVGTQPLAAAQTVICTVTGATWASGKTTRLVMYYVVD